MTIVLQHQFWDLRVDEAGTVSVGLSFGGVPATLGIPLGAVTAFADPHAGYGLRFRPAEGAAAVEPSAQSVAAEAGPTEPVAPSQVVSLDAFRRRPPARD
jgi:hypothetical protein